MRKPSVLAALVTLILIALMASAASAQQSGDLDPSLSSNFGSISLTPGFLPDPFTMFIRSGGDVDASAVGCAGYVTSAPDFELYLTDMSSRLGIFFVGAGDTTLIINDSNGEWHCNDDYSGVHPMVELTNAPGGTYDIWVGSYTAGSYLDGTLYITELGYSPADFMASSSSGNNGGAVSIGDVNSGGNSGNAIGIGDVNSGGNAGNAIGIGDTTP